MRHDDQGRISAQLAPCDSSHYLWLLRADGKLHLYNALDQSAEQCLDIIGRTPELSINRPSVRAQMAPCDQVSETWQYDAVGQHLKARWHSAYCLGVDLAGVYGLNQSRHQGRIQLEACRASYNHDIHSAERWQAIADDATAPIETDRRLIDAPLLLKTGLKTGQGHDFCLDVDTVSLDRLQGSVAATINHCSLTAYTQYWLLDESGRLSLNSLAEPRVIPVSSASSSSNAVDSNSVGSGVFTPATRLVEREKCLQANSSVGQLGQSVVVEDCSQVSSRWALGDGQLRLRGATEAITDTETDQCLQVDGRLDELANGQGLYLSACTAANSTASVELEDQWLAVLVSAQDLAALAGLKPQAQPLSLAHDDSLCVGTSDLGWWGNGSEVKTVKCDAIQYPVQGWMLMNDGKLHLGRNPDLCLDIHGRNPIPNGDGRLSYSPAHLTSCARVTERWHYQADNKFHAQWDEQLCLDVAGNNRRSSGATLQLEYCDQVIESFAGVSIGQLVGAPTPVYRALVNRYLGLCLTLRTDERRGVSALVGEVCDGGAAQQFYLEGDSGQLRNKQLDDNLVTQPNGYQRACQRERKVGFNAVNTPCVLTQRWHQDGQFLRQQR